LHKKQLFKDMKPIKSFFILALLSAAFIQACKDKEDDTTPAANDKCAAKNIVLTADITPTVKCENLGKLIVHARGSSGFTYQLGSAAFQSDSTFSNLSGGNYTVTVKDADGCTKSATFAVTETGSKGTNFTFVAAIIGAKCAASCHSTGQDNAPKGIFATDCDIVTRAALIKTKAYDGNMGNLNAGEKDKILTWINAGGGYDD
jgi:hypothetical protein